MASLRTKYSVAYDYGEPVEVLSTVQDLITAVDRVAANGSSGNHIALTVAIIYSALQRLGYDPKPYDEWVNLIDNYDEIKVVEGVEGPTQKEPLPIVPSPSPALRGQTGEAGLTKTQGRSKRPNSGSSTQGEPSE